MSYTQRYSTKVHYSGKVQYRYGPSKSGGHGTAHYSGDIPIDINVTVDTDPFDRSVRGTTDALTVVAGVVSATEVAQIAQIRSSAEKISQTVINGFFHTISSELSAQASECSSSMKSTVGLLFEQGKQVEHIHAQMEGDFNAIKARYARIFAELDRELDRRVRELDRPAFTISERYMQDVVASPYEQAAARAVTHSQDLSATPLKLLCAWAKAGASAAIDKLGRMCDYLTSYSRKTTGVMDEGCEAGYLYTPVVFSIQKDLNGAESLMAIHVPEGVSRDKVFGSVVAGIGNLGEDNWSQMSSTDRSEIDRCFSQRLGDYAANVQGTSEKEYRERVCRQIMGMYERAQTNTAYVG